MSMEMNKALDLLREIRPSIPKEVLELWCKDRDAFLASHPAVEQAGGDERAAFKTAYLAEFDCDADGDDNIAHSNTAWRAWKMARAALAHRAPEVCSECSDTGKVYDESGDGPWSCYACTGNPEVIGYANGDELDNMLDDRTAVLSPGKTSFHTVPVYRLIRAALAQSSPTPAEAERPELWAVHAQGPDELYAAFTREDAEKHAAELNALPMPEGIAVGAVVVPSPWPAVQHWQYLAEQEQDHKNEIAGRLRQLERICEGLPQAAIDGGWTVQGIRGYAKLLEDQLKAALARVAKLTATRNRYGVDTHYFNKNLQRILRDFESFTPDELARSLIILAKVADEKVVAQAQHSVPIAPELKRALGLVVAALEADGDRPTSKYALSELKKVLAAAPAPGGE